VTTKPDLVLCRDTVIDPNGFRVLVLGTVTFPAAVPREDRLVLWLHLVGEHQCILPLFTEPDELRDYHAREHREQPCAHGEASREVSLHRVGEVLSQPDEPDEPEPYEGSFCEAADNEGARIAAEASADNAKDD
jgi:hypothetical protein